MTDARAPATTVMDVLHHEYVHSRRVRVLAGELARTLPRGASVIDIGAGDGRLAASVRDHRPDVRIEAIDVLVRRETAIRVQPFDGERIPYGDGAFDVAMCVDVLHHASAPRALLSEAACVGRRVLLKDHLRDGLLAAPTLRLMDRLANARHGVALPFNYLSRREWMDAFAAASLEIEQWNPHVPLYPWPASAVFGRGLHFIALLVRRHDRE